MLWFILILAYIVIGTALFISNIKEAMEKKRQYALRPNRSRLPLSRKGARPCPPRRFLKRKTAIGYFWKYPERRRSI